MSHTRYIAFLLAASLFNVGAQAQMETLHYKVGSVAFTEDVDKIQIQSDPPLLIEVRPGGKTWPPLQLDETGRIFAGPAVIDPATGKHIALQAGGTSPNADSVMFPNELEVKPNSTGYEFRQRHSHCNVSYKDLRAPADRSPLKALQAANVKLAASDDKILVLVSSFLGDGRTIRYHIRAIEPRTCKVSELAKLGDPDLLVELGRTRHGGWWVTGSIEQTLMTSKDGRKWRSVKLPKGLSSLVSSYVVDDKQIWLAGVLGDSKEHPNQLVYSADGGASWTNLKKDDSLLAKVPAGWLEGQKRKVSE
jgi:hypothetical protein